MNLGFLKKKVGGIPVLYIVALFVGILAVIAWRMKSNLNTNPNSDQPTDGVAADQQDTTTNPYDKFATSGTVTVSQGTDPATVTPIQVATNETWARTAASWLASQGLATTDDAYAAMTAYVNGEQLSVTQGKLRDAAVKQYGLPPEPFTTGGTQTATPSTPPAVMQGKPPLVHTVRGPNDNDFWKLASIYYPNYGAKGVDLIEYHNRTLPSGHNNLPVGTKVSIVPYSDREWTATRNITTADVAAMNGTTPDVISILNNTPTNHVFAKGSSVRLPS